jgi:hypothetical protein
MLGQRGGFEGKARRVLPTVDAALPDGEERLATAVLRGLGRGADVGRVVDWILVVTDRRVLLFTLPLGPDPTPALLSSYPRGEVLVLDAQLSRASPTVVLRFPGAELAYFHPPAGWREQAAQVVAELGRVVPYPESDSEGSGERTSAHDARP